MSPLAGSVFGPRLFNKTSLFLHERTVMIESLMFKLFFYAATSLKLSSLALLIEEI